MLIAILINAASGSQKRLMLPRMLCAAGLHVQTLGTMYARCMLEAAQAELRTPSGMSHGAVWFASCRMTVKERPTLLLDLPDPCLLKVLQCCADDQRSLFNAARAHPTLHRAAVVALSSISADIWRQRKVDGAVLLYWSKYRQHVRSVTVAGYPENYRRAIHVRELPPDLQLNRLELTSNLNVQLQPGGGFQGVVRLGVPLTQLVISQCNMLDGKKGLAAALALLPGLQHLVIYNSCQYDKPVVDSRGGCVLFPADRLRLLQQLTLLELVDIDPQAPGSLVPDLQPLSSLTRLAALDLKVAMFQLSFKPSGFN